MKGNTQANDNYVPSYTAEILAVYLMSHMHTEKIVM